MIFSYFRWKFLAPVVFEFYESEVGFDPKVKQCSTWSNVVKLGSNRADFWHPAIFGFEDSDSEVGCELEFEVRFDPEVEQYSTCSNVVKLGRFLVFAYDDSDSEVGLDPEVEQCLTW
ncbi:hypothetical protein Ddc_22553 [Ditylenchus destructor]|nr:hypothetical protein Ddc_22553 [Ditylenchus destructor]